MLICVCRMLTLMLLLQVKKIYENEKRLQAGEHSLDLLARDFQKNYNMYIFPVHWQFGQLDQHPVDGYVPGRPSETSSTHTWSANRQQEMTKVCVCCRYWLSCCSPDTWPTRSSPRCAPPSFPWSIAPPVSLRSATLTKTSTSPWRSGPPASASKSVSVEFKSWTFESKHEMRVKRLRRFYEMFKGFRPEV